QHLAVEPDLRLPASGDELVVREPVLARCGVDAQNPEPPKLALAVLSVAVRVSERMLDLLLGLAIARVLEAPVALRLLENLAALLARVDGSLDAWHRLPDPEQLLDRLHVGLVHRHRLAEAALTLRRLLLEQVAAHRRPAHQLARSGHLEALLGCALSLCLRHLVWSLPRSS